MQQTDWKRCRNSLYYVWNFFLSLKLFQKKSFLKGKEAPEGLLWRTGLLGCHCAFEEYTKTNRGWMGVNSPHDPANIVARVLEVTSVWVDISWKLLGTWALPQLCMVFVTPPSTTGSGGLGSLHSWPLVWQPPAWWLGHDPPSCPRLASDTPCSPRISVLSPEMEDRNLSHSLQIRGSLARKP